MKSNVISVFVAVGVALGITLTTSTAAAEPPWAKGVSQETQDKANALFAEANQLFAQQAHAPALEKYKAAIALWDHPLIRFNMAVTLIRLDRILEAADALDSALRFNKEPFDPALYQQALDYQALIRGRVGYIDASCDQAGARVLLDGKPWFTCAGSQKQRVLAGEHAVVGELNGFLTSSQHIVVTGGAVSTHKVMLVPLDAAVTIHYPTARWIPWTIAGGGAAVALGGLGFWLAGRSQMDKFEADFAMTCPSGCKANLSDQPLLKDERDSAKLKGEIAVSMMISGGAIAATGIVWTILNRPQRVLPDIEVSPTAHGGMSARVGWRF